MTANLIFDAVLSGAGSLELETESQDEEKIVFKGEWGHATVYADGRVESQVGPYKAGLEAIIVGQEPPVKAKNGRSSIGQANTSIPPRKCQGEALVKPGDSLTLEKVREYFCKTATDEECAFALEVCQIRGLNPFKADCYLVKYGGANPKLEILVSNSFLLKKAMANPDFEYFKAGATVQKGEMITDERREYAYPGETLLGGWAEIKRKSISVPFYVSIPLAGNKKESHFWKDTPGHMIRKTASSQVCREAFPEELAGLYDVDELGIDPSKEVR